ncbi:citramalate synthase [Arthrobacter sp. zg-ZUI100]|uniref:citramalate synthase n=1 Tax=Arthrobacter jiangjiafuii TaxID=2817475 RepID=UPI001AEE6282|nr:citramalate synthase [Arthrobacter jiangjiafuii]MBP3037477.1 citramalate synthase [Arthrobacter jiangjiafuii]
MAGKESLPRVSLVEEALREGMQIESADIPVDRKLQLLNVLSRSGLTNIVIGSFVSPRWVPQMGRIDELASRFEPADGVSYTALALNAKGRERIAQYAHKLTADDPKVGVSRFHLCDVFVQRNTARTTAQERSSLAATVEEAKAAGAVEAEVCVNAAWGSNWVGPFTQHQRMEALRTQITAWEEAGIPVTRVQLGDPMSWNTPKAVRAQIALIKQTWPQIHRFQLHLHDARGMAMLSAYEAMYQLEESDHLVVDTGLGGMGGCPYCGNGRLTGMIPTEDFVHLLESEGIETGIDLSVLIEAAALAAEMVGHDLWGRVSKAGPRPEGADVYPMDMPFIETFEQAQHFRFGAKAYQGASTPWKQPITSAQRDEYENSARNRGGHHGSY